jgi:hypothetical protein
MVVDDLSLSSHCVPCFLDMSPGFDAGIAWWSQRIKADYNEGNISIERFIITKTGLRQREGILGRVRAV